MGTDQPVERDLYQGLIKLAAAYVHDARGNPAGIAKNLAGARQRLGAVIGRGDLPPDLPAQANQLNLRGLVNQIDVRLAELVELAGNPSSGISGPPIL